ncbi:low molecular weight phosphotyrosine protein phosphatase [Ketobacter sp. MCCC 1A13808]|uniref:low molecular weight protein-tyrosine-phosphatase n=1 Tax=Ketobacter sp. MCCC 1A13808 TaxID=2602738 RepID=UPI0012EC119F|nr:low molecular weight protein-tyrosine-phosphatase [Ketobacter sp. MCCC 1A13808]MVF13941.1 low molecular weight phosphotyrosine protein phosphatase [Ketobacter sp. MCCC 1A13808]
MFNEILIVCIGNICRSPTGEYLFKQKLTNKPNVKVHSAGVGALVDHPIDETAGQLLLENGIDAGDHKARQLSTQMLVDADLILTMDSSLIKSINSLAPQVSGKIFLLSKWSSGAAIGDPYRKSREAFEHVYKKIDSFTNDWLKYL